MMIYLFLLHVEKCQ